MHIALATSDEFPVLAETEKPLITAFESLGVTATPVVWNSPLVGWSSFDAVIIRSIWDYHTHITAFYEWLDKLDSLGARTLNATKTLRWNSHKRYLLDLQAKGIRLTPTTIVMQSDTQTLSDLLDSTPGSDFVLKPCYGASAYGIMKVTKGSISAEHERAFQALKKHSDVLLQAYVPEISQGEVSAVFIDGLYSHAVLKTPKAGGFVSNNHQGGREDPYSMDQPVLEQIIAMHANSGFSDSLYTRVDFVLTNEGPLLMELELLEPYLFFEFRPESYKLFAKATIEHLQGEAT